MEEAWPEVSLAFTENRRELHLTGAEISKRIETKGLDVNVYRLVDLNYLEVSRTCLTKLHPELGGLAALTDLVLHNNKLTAVPPEIGILTKIKYLDLSNNSLSSFPPDVASLPCLHTLNVGMNCLTEFPPVGEIKSLHVFRISHNKLTSLPEGLCSSKLIHLSEISASNNQITELPVEVSSLPHLNKLDLSVNQLQCVPPHLSECTKLKDLDLKDNKFVDRRFGKLVEQKTTKSVLEYLATLMAKEKGKDGKKDKKKKGRGRKTEQEEMEELAKNMIRVLRFPDETGTQVAVKPAVISVRPFIVCCIVRNLNFNKTEGLFKQFIMLQTKLHDGVCQKRQAATIATHDLKTVKLPVSYDAKFPRDIMVSISVIIFKRKSLQGICINCTYILKLAK
ncbi:hypothetical protein ScPMuIL_005789 [Solemya velum]